MYLFMFSNVWIFNSDYECVQSCDAELSGSQLWLAVSADRRVSVWSADWSRDSCELVDWLTFPAPAVTPDGLVAKSTDSVSKSC